MAGVGVGGGVDISVGIDVCVLPLSLIFFIDLITFSSVSITSPFLSVILPPSTLYFDKKLVVDNTSLIGGSCFPSSIAFVFKFKYSIFTVSYNSDFYCSFLEFVAFAKSPFSPIVI